MAIESTPKPPPPSDDPLRRFLDVIAHDLTAAAAGGRLRPTYRRDAEVELLLQRLARSGNARPLVIGPPKVGKTAVVHEAVRRMAAAQCAVELASVRVFEVAPSQLVLHFGEEWKNQLQTFLQDVARHDDVVLYWRDLATSVRAGAQSGQADVELAQLVADHVGDSGLRCIAEVRPNTWRRLTGAVPDLEEVFARIAIAVPPPDAVDAIVQAVADDLEAEHGVAIDASAREAAISLTGRFNVAQAFPGKAIEMLADTVAEAVAGGDPGPVAAPAVAACFSRRTGLSRALIDDSIPFDEQAVRASLAEHVIGQDQAIEAIVQTISLVRARLNDPTRPLGVFLFLGPTGVGKTELSKALAAWLFGNDSRIVRFNMADYSAQWQAMLLFGDPDPDEDLPTRRGQLTVRLADEPFAVLLLDEFEKAHGAIFQRFLQLFDEGVLINGDGETVNLRNAIIIATSNFGAHEADSSIGFVAQASREDADTTLERALEAYFTPEFINRLDRVCFFKTLGKPALHRIARREVESLLLRDGIRKRGLLLEIDDEVIEQVVERGYSPRFGARHLKRQIERTVTYPLAQAIIGAPTRPGDLIRLFVRRGRIEAARVPAEADRAPAPADVSAAASTAPDDPARRFTVVEMQDALDDLRARVARIEDFHDVAARRAESRDRMAAMSDPTFWDDARQAEAALAELADLTRIVDLCDGLRGAVDDMAAALDRVTGRGERTQIGEAARQYRYLLRELPRAELDLLLTDPWDSLDAYLLLHASDTSGPAWIEDLLGAYAAWADRRGLAAAAVDETRDASGRLTSAALAVRGHGAYGLLKGEAGAHRWLQHRDDGARETFHVRVEVIPDLAPRQITRIDPDAVDVEGRPVNARGRRIHRLRSHAEAAHPASGTRVALTNDLSVDDNRALAQHLVAALVTARARREAEPAPVAEADDLWGAVVRTYCVFKNPYVRDMRTGITETHVRKVLDGYLDPFLEGYLRLLAGSGG